MDELQSGIEVTGSRVAGTLYYVSDFDQFSPGDADLCQGHYVALKFEAPEGSTVTVQVFDNEVARSAAQELDSDMNLICRVTDPVKTKLKVTVSMDGAEDLVKVYRLGGLKLLDTPSPVDHEDDGGEEA